MINDIDISDSLAEDDTLSQYSSKDVGVGSERSAIAKAAAINRSTEETGVYAQAGVTRTDGDHYFMNLVFGDGSFGNNNGIIEPEEEVFGNSGPITGPVMFDEEFYMEINGQTITGFEMIDNDANGNLRAAINELSEVTGVFAELNDENELVLIAPDGRDISMLTLNWKKHLPNTIFICPNGHEKCSINPSGYQWFDLTKEDPEYILEQSLNA